MKLKQALELALAQLGPFAESSLYEDYKAEDGFTDADWDAMMAKLRQLADEGENVLERARTQIRDGIIFSYPQGDLCEAPQNTIYAISGLIGEHYDIETGGIPGETV